MEKNNEEMNLKWYDITTNTFIVTTIVSLLLSIFLVSNAMIAYLLISLISLTISIITSIIIKRKITLKKLIAIVFLILLSICIGMYVLNNNYESTSITKPIIYLYPEETTEVNVFLENPNLLTHTYPKYDENTGWNVIAEPSGNLKYLNNDKEQNLYALYWEGNSAKDKKIEDDGFIVKGEDTVDFLEEKLALLGLNEREAEEFIVYWLPRMEENKYNYIRFETANEIEQNMPLNISPKPDTTIRIMMDWCEINSESEANRLSHNIKEQELTTPEREGFVAVEWGGSMIN